VTIVVAVRRQSLEPTRHAADEILLLETPVAHLPEEIVFTIMRGVAVRLVKHVQKVGDPKNIETSHVEFRELKNADPSLPRRPENVFRLLPARRGIGSNRDPRDDPAPVRRDHIGACGWNIERSWTLPMTSGLLTF
jgi:hypothetical protein